jgi:hypothetical protein
MPSDPLWDSLGQHRTDNDVAFLKRLFRGATSIWVSVDGSVIVEKGLFRHNEFAKGPFNYKTIVAAEEQSRSRSLVCGRPIFWNRKRVRKF